MCETLFWNLQGTEEKTSSQVTCSCSWRRINLSAEGGAQHALAPGMSSSDQACGSEKLYYDDIKILIFLKTCILDILLSLSAIFKYYAASGEQRGVAGSRNYWYENWKYYSGVLFLWAASHCRFARSSRFQSLGVTNLHRKIPKKLLSIYYK